MRLAGALDKLPAMAGKMVECLHAVTIISGLQVNYWKVDSFRFG